jgi:hypothetical protein
MSHSRPDFQSSNHPPAVKQALVQVDLALPDNRMIFVRTLRTRCSPLTWPHSTIRVHSYLQYLGAGHSIPDRLLKYLLVF